MTKKRTRRARAALEAQRSGEAHRGEFSVANLQRITRAQCESEVKTWCRGISIESWLMPMVKGALDRQRTELEARDIYERARRAAARGTLEKMQTEISAYNKRTPHGAGGMAAMTLVLIEQALAQGTIGGPGYLHPLSEIDARYFAFGIGHWGAAEEPFSVLVWTLFHEAPRPPVQREMTNRIAACIAILYDAAPKSWLKYEGWGTPSRIIRDVETRVRKIVGPDSQ